jgi:uncharacterized paraquat-inducible protein A
MEMLQVPKQANVLNCGMNLTLTGKELMKTDAAKAYTCPIHTTVVRHEPGKCPKCGKKLNLSAKEQMKAEVGKVILVHASSCCS